MLKIKSLYSITRSGTDEFSCSDRVSLAGRSGVNPHSGRSLPDRYTIRSRSVWTLFLIGVALALSACSGTQPEKSPEDTTIEEALRLFDESTPVEGQTPAESENSKPGFSILLTGVPANLRNTPELALKQVVDATGLDTVRLLQKDANTPPLIVYGHYDDPAAERAQADLKRVRAMDVGGRTPFRGAVMVREGEARPAGGRLARPDLRQAKALFGPDAVYTLQIGVYAREDNKRPSAADLAVFRKSAEEAVQRLRREGEQAFFYHGPNGSMVTVGVFDDSDLDTSVSPPLSSPRLKAAQDRHPHNLLNGRGVRATTIGEDGTPVERMQASRLVLIPE